METMAIMAVMAIVSTIISTMATTGQRNKELDAQKQLLEDEQQFQAEREDLLYQRNSAANQYQQMLDAGFNPNLAANAVLGGNGSVASSSSSPSAPPVNSAIGALSSMFGQGGQNLYDLVKNNAEIQNIDANTNKTNIESGIMPREFALKQLSTTEQLKVWDASVRRTKAAQHLDEVQTKLVQQQHLYYGKLTDAQIASYNAQVNKAYNEASLALEQIKTEKSKQTNLDTQSALNQANARVSDANVRLIDTEQSTEYYKSESARIAQEFEKKLGNIPLTADAQKYVQGLISNGDIDGVKNFYLNIFATAQNQELGTSLGGQKSKISAPFGLFSKDYPIPALRTYQQMPVWNMYSYPSLN